MNSIFALITNENFFKPFLSKNKEVYFECILKVIEYSKTHVFVDEIDLRDMINLYLNNSKLEYYEEEDDGYLISKSGADIIRYFRECGWLTERELGRSGNYITNVTSLCRRLIDFLVSLMEKSDDGAISNHILAMYDIISSINTDDIRKERPYSNILNPLVKEMDGLKAELIDLRENIGKIMQVAMSIESMSNLGNFMLRDEILEKFFNDYFYVKNNGTIPTIINKIKAGLRKLNNKEWINKIVEQYMVVKDEDENTSLQYIERKLSELNEFLTYDYQEHMKDIEKQIDNYYVLAHSKVMLFSKNGMNIEAALDKLLIKIKKMDEKEEEALVNNLNEALLIETQKYIGVKSFANRRKRIKDDTSSAITYCDLTEEEALELTSVLFQNKNRFNINEVKAYLSEKMQYKDCIQLKDVLIESRYDALMYISAISFAHNEDFAYQVEILDEIINIGIGCISNISIRKGKTR